MVIVPFVCGVKNSIQYIGPLYDVDGNIMQGKSVLLIQIMVVVAYCPLHM